MRLSLKLFLMLSALLLLALAGSSWAACSIAADSKWKPFQTVTMPFAVANITAGEDLPIYSLVFEQIFGGFYTEAVTVECTTQGTFVHDASFSSTPLPLSSAAPAIAAGKTYQTGVPGLGIYFRFNTANAVIPDVKTTYDTSCSNTKRCSSPLFQTNAYIVKTGPISPGTIDGSKLPCVLQRFGQNNSMVNIVRVCMSGTLTIVAKTCTTPNVNVYLGSFDLDASFKGIGTVTKWVDSSINLTNCPRFYGKITNDVEAGQYLKNEGFITAASPSANSLSLRLQPNTSIIDSARGIIGLAPGGASGIGIQLAIGTTNQAIINLGNADISTQAMANTASTTAQFPLSARYIQTAQTVTPGKANATVTFTINYR